MDRHDETDRCCHDDVPHMCPTCDPRRSPYEPHPMPDWFRETYHRFQPHMEDHAL